jgi:methylenetetrahydrofolate reductase (NADPH)
MKPASSVTSAGALLVDFSIEITGRDASALTEAAALLPRGTAVNVTYLANEDRAARVKASSVVRAQGLRPVPHISARRLGSLSALEDFLSDLEAVNAASEVFVIGGDPAEPDGPFTDALSLIETGIFGRYGVHNVGVAGYPEGHPHISDDALWSALNKKLKALDDQSIRSSITTQLSFDAVAVAAWITIVRESGIDVPIRIGVPGPAGIRRLIGYARRLGVRSSAGLAAKYGLSLGNLVGTADPGPFIEELAALLTAAHGPVSVHFYTFGGVVATAKWAASATQGTAP